VAGITLLDTAPADALQFDVRVIRWRCTVTDSTGTEYDQLHVPLGRAVHLAFHDPDTDLDVALDGTPATAHLQHGGTAALTFRIDRPGDYHWTCPTQRAPGPTATSNTQPIVAMPAADYAAYQARLREAAHPTTLAGKIALGKKIAEGCTGCHTLDGTPKLAVSLGGLWGTQAPMMDGSSRVVDAAFVTEALLHPQAVVRPGYPPTMPSYEGRFKPYEMEALLAYIESLGTPK
jgi:cytochrome c oxidase subunit 2